MSPLSNLAARDVETLVHPYINLARFRETGPLIIERGQGVYVYDTDGKPYIEGMAGLWCTALGYGNEELVEAAATQMRKLSFAHLFTGKSHDPAIELAEKLKEIAPVPISKGVLLQFRLGGQRHPGQARLVFQQRARPAAEEKDRQPDEGLSRRHRRRRLADRACPATTAISTCRCRASCTPAVRITTASPHGRRERGGIRHAACRRARCADRQGRSRHRRRLHRRAGDGRRRRDRAAQDLFRKDHGGVRQARRVHDQRRGDLRLRPARHDVRLREARLSRRIRSRSPRRCRRPICRSPAS